MCSNFGEPVDFVRPRPALPFRVLPGPSGSRRREVQDHRQMLSRMGALCAVVMGAATPCNSTEAFSATSTCSENRARGVNDERSPACGFDWRRRMGIEPTARGRRAAGFEDQGSHQTFIRLPTLTKNQHSIGIAIVNSFQVQVQCTGRCSQSRHLCAHSCCFACSSWDAGSSNSRQTRSWSFSRRATIG